MDIRYCDKCGDIIQGEFDPEATRGACVCPGCCGDQPTAQESAPTEAANSKLSDKGSTGPAPAAPGVAPVTLGSTSRPPGC